MEFMCGQMLCWELVEYILSSQQYYNPYLKCEGTKDPP